MIRLPPRVAKLMTSVPFRLLVAGLIVGYHVYATISFARARFGLPFDNAPTAPPVFTDPLHDTNPVSDRRLVVSRWDSGQYIDLALRGYTACAKHPGRLTDAELADQRTCRLSFYPGYSMLGRAVRAITRWPIDYSLWAVSLLASFLLLFLWTDAAITKVMGVGATYASLLAFGLFGTSCYLVFIMSEPCTLLFTMASLVAFARGKHTLSALAAGAASAMRISGGAASMSFALAIIVLTLRDRPRNGWVWAWRALLIPLSAWGALAIAGYQWSRFGDANLYVHAHAAAYGHHGGIAALTNLKAEWLIHSMDGPAHDTVWGMGLVLWFLLGHRLALRRFPGAMQTFCYALVITTLGISVFGTIDLYLTGLSRYALVAIPLFFAIGAFLKDRPVVLGLWLALCVWHSHQVDLCYYLGDVGQPGLKACHMTQWLDW